MDERELELFLAAKELLAQLVGLGIYIPGQDEGQWENAEGLSFARIEAAVLALEEVPPAEGCKAPYKTAVCRSCHRILCTTEVHEEGGKFTCEACWREKGVPRV